MKRLVLIGIAICAAGGCQIPSGLTTPTASSSGGGSTFTVAASCPSPVGTPLPFAVFGHSTAAGCGGTLPSQLTPVFSVQPTQGFATLNVDFSMCGSTDTDPAITLHYAVDYGDGSQDGTDKACQLHHQYTGPGTFTATECVWDELPADAPGICKTFTVSVSPSCSVTFINPNYTCSGNVISVVSTRGSSTCGEPLVVGRFENGALVATQQIVCPPGAKPAGIPAVGGFLILPFTLIEGPCIIDIPGGSQNPVTLKGLNATGSVTIPAPGC
jgi:hypothetical protein